MSDAAIDPTAPPSGTGCAQCLTIGGWWVHLRRCATCGHIGCCDSSIGRHATAHFHETGHRYIQSFEPGEDWFWDYAEQLTLDGPVLAAPRSRPSDQPSPGPSGRVPQDWRARLAAQPD